MRVFVSLVFICNIVFANYSEADIANTIKKYAKEYDIDQRILYTIAKIESGFNPKAIAFVSKTKNPLKFSEVKVKTARYKDKYIISLSPHSKKKAISLAKQIINAGYKVDIGLFQINSVNFKYNEIEKMFNIDDNAKKAVEILNFCSLKKQKFKNTIECYNKGLRSNTNLDYYNKFKNSFIKDFS
ncbi:transglycosylase SLT domain-containing protein [Campylobacter lanienae]|uniref:transglycosylase SLT domain-containing protein n=1 Tax=Campylobacter lanienae TaxID=75658 RepID=UPI000BB42AE7|nr:transglycosylase SLT domain-containing protein [Campylobacter lanienae]